MRANRVWSAQLELAAAATYFQVPLFTCTPYPQTHHYYWVRFEPFSGPLKYPTLASSNETRTESDSHTLNFVIRQPHIMTVCCQQTILFLHSVSSSWGIMNTDLSLILWYIIHYPTTNHSLLHNCSICSSLLIRQVLHRPWIVTTSWASDRDRSMDRGFCGYGSHPEHSVLKEGTTFLELSADHHQSQQKLRRDGLGIIWHSI